MYLKNTNSKFVWLIDLDDTLFFSGGKVMSTINSRMTSFIQSELSISFEEANRLRVEYWKRYGTTARGMQERHGVSFQPFLSFSHHLPCFELYIKFKPIVARSIKKVDLTKYWAVLAARYNSLPLTKEINADLEDYVVNKAIDGLFILIKQEENNIRNNPEARVSEILQRVFR